MVVDRGMPSLRAGSRQQPRAFLWWWIEECPHKELVRASSHAQSMVVDRGMPSQRAGPRQQPRALYGGG